MAEATNIVFIRHGTTLWMEQGKLHGRSDSELSPRGIQEAERAAKALTTRRFAAAYTSPLGRARQTAAILTEHIGVRPLSYADLIEVDFGWMEGSRVQGVLPPGSSALTRLRRAFFWKLVAISGESLQQVHQRVLEALLALHRAHPGQTLLAVSHTVVIRSATYHATGFNYSQLDHIDWAPCGISEFMVHADGSVELLGLNARARSDGTLSEGEPLTVGDGANASPRAPVNPRTGTDQAVGREKKTGPRE